MYLHLGQDIVVRTRDIIGIFDLDNATISKTTRIFLSDCEKNGTVVNVSYELPKSFIVCSEPGKNGKQRQKVYISQISSATLRKRARYIDHIANI